MNRSRTRTPSRRSPALSTLGTIARIRTARGRSEFYQLVALLYPRSSVAEAYRTLRANVEFASVAAPLHTLLVTSAAPGEGKTVTASNLAVVFAQAGRTVLLVDADLRKPGVHEMFNLPNVRGLTTMLRDDSLGLDAVAQATEQANLRILTTGPLPPNPAELLGSHRMQAVLALMKQEADLVIFDSPPVQAVTDAAVLSSFADGTLLVIDAGRSRRRGVRAAVETLDEGRGQSHRCRSQPGTGSLTLRLRRILRGRRRTRARRRSVPACPLSHLSRLAPLRSPPRSRMWQGRQRPDRVVHEGPLTQTAGKPAKASAEVPRHAVVVDDDPLADEPALN